MPLTKVEADVLRSLLERAMHIAFAMEAAAPHLGDAYDDLLMVFARIEEVCLDGSLHQHDL